MRVLTDALSALFAPRRIALVGASDKPGRAGTLFWHNLAGFAGEVVPVTSSAATVSGVRTYPSLGEVPGPIDLAVVCVPAAGVPGVIRDAGVAGIPVAVVVSGGFAETGPAGALLQAEALAAARAGGVRLVGPNSLGVQNCDLPMNASMARRLPDGGGGITLVTQSGAYGMAVESVGRDEGTRFAKVLSVGNKADISDAELLRHLGQDPASRTLCFFCESIPDGRDFIDAATAVTPDKPIIVTRTGRSAAGARAAVCHTGALAGDDRLWRAAFAAAGILLARSGLEMLDAARALDGQPVPAGHRVAVLTNSGGTGVELADLLADEGLHVPQLSLGLRRQLRTLLPAHAGVDNPVDLTTVWSRYAELYPQVLDLHARSGEVDVDVPVLLQRAATDPAVVHAVADATRRLRADAVGVGVYVCWVTSRAEREYAEPLAAAGVPCFDWPERTARAVGHAVRYGTARVSTRARPDAPPRPEGIHALAEGVLPAGAAEELLRRCGIALAETLVARSADEAVAVVAAVVGSGGSAVAKVLHPDLVHKTDVDGVRVGLSHEEEVRTAARHILALAPGAEILVQPELTGVPVAVGAVRDSELGPMVMVGLGGVHVELLDDVAFGLAPLSEDAARDLVLGLRGAPLLTGSRGSAPVNLAALVRLLRAVGDLVASVPEIIELDLNPVLVSATAAVAVDWRVRTEISSAQDEEPTPV